MVKCPECPKEFKNAAGLSGHLRQIHGQSGRLSQSVPVDLLERIGAALEHSDGESSDLGALRKELEAVSKSQNEALLKLEEQVKAVAESSTFFGGLVKVGAIAGGGYFLWRVLSNVKVNEAAK